MEESGEGEGKKASLCCSPATKPRETKRDHTQAVPTPYRHFFTCGCRAWLEGLQTHHRWTRLIKSQV